MNKQAEKEYLLELAKNNRKFANETKDQAARWRFTAKANYYTKKAKALDEKEKDSISKNSRSKAS
jgi:hypothetical protein